MTSALILNAQYDTLRQFELPIEFAESRAFDDDSLLVSRFDLVAPFVLNEIQIHTTGQAGDFTVRIFGHEGGNPVPILKSDSTEPIKVNKSTVGYEMITLSLDEEIPFSNNQLFVSIESKTEGLIIMQEDKLHKPSCSDENAGAYYFGYILDKEDDWKYHDQSFYITLIGSYTKDSGFFMKDKTRNSGLPSTLESRYISVGDVNKDGWQDLLAGGRLFLNQEGKFKLSNESSKKQMVASACRGNIFIDFNCDGHLDYFVFGARETWLYLNNGSSLFEVIKVDLPDLKALSAYSFGDINGDQFPDLFLGQLWTPYPNPMPNYLFLNDRNGGFIDITKRLYPSHIDEMNYPNGFPIKVDDRDNNLPNGNQNRRTRASQFVDYDLDGDLDLYVGNYFLEQDELFVNNGYGYFTDIIADTPIDKSKIGNNHATGVDWADYDNDGDPDLLLSQLAHPKNIIERGEKATQIYRNDNPVFEEISNQLGIAYEETQTGGRWVDLNNDGLMDIYFGAYYNCTYSEIYLQNQNGTFETATWESGLWSFDGEADAVFFDYNNDGKQDLITGVDNQLVLLENQWEHSNSFVKVSLEGEHIVSAKLQLSLDDGTIQTKVLTAGKGQKMHDGYTAHFGIPEGTTIKQLTVDWPSGKSVSYVLTKLGIHYLVTEDGELNQFQ